MNIVTIVAMLLAIFFGMCLIEAAHQIRQLRMALYEAHRLLHPTPVGGVVTRTNAGPRLSETME